jgi:hypothetical protein
MGSSIWQKLSLSCYTLFFRKMLATRYKPRQLRRKPHFQLATVAQRGRNILPQRLEAELFEFKTARLEAMPFQSVSEDSEPVCFTADTRG